MQTLWTRVCRWIVQRATFSGSWMLVFRKMEDLAAVPDCPLVLLATVLLYV